MWIDDNEARLRKIAGTAAAQPTIPSLPPPTFRHGERLRRWECEANGREVELAAANGRQVVRVDGRKVFAGEQLPAERACAAMLAHVLGRV